MKQQGERLGPAVWQRGYLVRQVLHDEKPVPVPTPCPLCGGVLQLVPALPETAAWAAQPAFHACTTCEHCEVLP
jgi:hypothetical protein